MRRCIAIGGRQRVELPLLTGEYENLHIQKSAYIFQKPGSGATGWMNKD
jgi:hypothetical protein